MSVESTAGGRLGGASVLSEESVVSYRMAAEDQVQKTVA